MAFRHRTEIEIRGIKEVLIKCKKCDKVHKVNETCIDIERIKEPKEPEAKRG